MFLKLNMDTVINKLPPKRHLPKIIMLLLKLFNIKFNKRKVIMQTNFLTGLFIIIA